MANITLPKKDGRGNSQGWLQADKKAHQAMWQLGLKHPMALAVLHFLTSRMDRGTNGVVMSAQALAQTMGIAQRTVQNSIKILDDARFIQILKSGKSNVYVINHQVAWQGSRGMRHASFGAEILLTEVEQLTPVDTLIQEAKALHSVPILDFGERVFVGNDQIDPPDQQEMNLP